MKKITIVLVLFFLNIGNSFCQESGKFLVFTFNCVYEIGEYKHGTGDNLWIIPYDSCLTNFSDRKLTPLFADDYLINSLSDSITNNQSFGYFPTTDYESNSNALKILKNRRTIQCRTTKFFFKNSKEFSESLFVLLFNFQGPFRSLLPPPSAFRLRSPLEERSLSISLPSLFVNPLFSIFSNFFIHL